jgi:hypothetical protein
MTERNAEYDRFGPWIIEISADDPVPSLFEPYLARTEAPLLAVKIPRRITRRDARPGMDLYDYLVSLYEDDLLVLQRDGHGVRTLAVAYRDIRHLRVREDLLLGNLHLGLPDAPVDLPYNTVSSQLMQRLVGLVKERCRVPGWVRTPLSVVTPIDELSFWFEGLRQAMREENPDMQPIAAQADTRVGSTGSGLLRRIAFGIVDKRLLESLHQTDGEVLMVMDRGRPYAYRWQSVYGREETWMPLANITHAAWDDDPRAATTTLTIGTGGSECQWTFLHGNPTLAPYAAFLDRLLARPSRGQRKDRSGRQG